MYLLDVAIDDHDPACTAQSSSCLLAKFSQSP